MAGWQDIPGWTDEHMLGLYDWAIERAPTERTSRFAELGVAFGRSLAYAHERIEASGKQITLVGVDPFIVEGWIQRDLGQYIQEHGGFREACLHYLKATCGAGGPTVTACTAVEAAQRIQKRNEAGHRVQKRDPDLAFDLTFDFVFIDADHTYESLLADLKAWWPLIRVGGAIAGHDHTGSFPGVEQACREFFGEGGYDVVGTCFRKVRT